MVVQRAPISGGVAGEGREHFGGRQRLGSVGGDAHLAQLEFRLAKHLDLDRRPRPWHEQAGQIGFVGAGQSGAEFAARERWQAAALSLKLVRLVQDICSGLHVVLPGNQNIHPVIPRIGVAKQIGLKLGGLRAKVGLIGCWLAAMIVTMKSGVQPPSSCCCGRAMPGDTSRAASGRTGRRRFLVPFVESGATASIEGALRSLGTS